MCSYQHIFTYINNTKQLNKLQWLTNNNLDTYGCLCRLVECRPLSSESPPQPRPWRTGTEAPPPWKSWSSASWAPGWSSGRPGSPRKGIWGWQTLFYLHPPEKQNKQIRKDINWYIKKARKSHQASNKMEYVRSTPFLLLRTGHRSLYQETLKGEEKRTRWPDLAGDQPPHKGAGIPCRWNPWQSWGNPQIIFLIKAQ